MRRLVRKRIDFEIQLHLPLFANLQLLEMVEVWEPSPYALCGAFNYPKKVNYTLESQMRLS